MSDFYITEKRELITKLETLSQVSIADDGTSHLYHDENNNEDWILTSYDTEAGQEHLFLKKLPAPTTAEAINIAINSRKRNDIAGAIFDLLAREKHNGEDFRLQLIHALKLYINDNPSFDKERVKLIIHQCELTDARNRRNILGKNYSEVEKDATHFQTLAQEACAILKSIAV